MLKKYTSEQFWKLYEKLPQELKDVLWAEETGNNIESVCQRYGIEDDVGDIIDLVGQVLVGVLAPDDFQEALEKELKLEKDTTKKVAQEINRFIFYPVRTELEKLYQTKTAPTGKVILEKIDGSILAPTQTKENEPAGPKNDDTYREPVK